MNERPSYLDDERNPYRNFGASEGPSPETARRRGVLRALWSSIVIAAVSALIVVTNVVGAGAVSADPTPEPTETSALEARYLTRVAIGLREISGGSIPADGRRQLVRNFEVIATDPFDRVRVAVALAEIDAADEARVVLDDASAQLDEYEAAVNGSGTALDSELAASLRDDPEATRQWVAELRTDIETVRATIDGTATPAADMDRFRDRYGWFGDVLAMHGTAATDPQRQRIEGEALAATIVLVLMIVVAVLAILSGLVLCIALSVLIGRGHLRRRLNWRPDMRPDVRMALIETVALFLVGFVVVGLVAGVIEAATGVNAQFGLVWLLLLVLLWPLVRGMSWRELVLALGWHANGAGLGGAFKEAGLGVVGYLAGLPIVGFGLVVSLMLVSLTGAEASHPVVEEAIDTSLGGALLLYSLAAVWAPVVEESVFRGAMYVGMRRSLGMLGAGLVNSFVFAVIHPQGWALVPALMSLAIVFGLIREFRGSLIGAVVAHAVHNAFLVTLLIFVVG